MHTELEDWKNSWHGVQLALTHEEIDTLIERLQMLKTEPDQHFHLTSTYKGSGGVGDITIYVQDPSEPDNMESIGSKALAPGHLAPRLNCNESP
ncbi:hypothetical protein BH09VER1_BH09VER1_55460 [soil metagenome]